MAYAGVNALREFLGDAFTEVKDDTLEGYLDYASMEIDLRLAPRFAVLPFDPVSVLIERMCLYRATTEILTIYYGRSGVKPNTRAQHFREDYEMLLALIERDPALARTH